MKSHAYPKLLLAVGGLAVSIASGFSAQAIDSSILAVERSTPNLTADSNDLAAASDREKNLLAIVEQRSSIVARGAVCGNSELEPGEQCDDGNAAGGDGCSATCQVEPNFDCTLPIPGQLTENIMGDGSFEDNDGSWALAGNTFSPRCSPTLCGPDLATDGDFYLWLGGGAFDGGNNPGTATQTLVIPTNATALTFDYAIGSNAVPPDECENPALDRLEVRIDGTLVFRSANPCVGVFPFVNESVDLTTGGFNDGGSHTIVFSGFNVDNPPGNGILTNIFLDNVELSVPANPPIPPVPSACFQGVCGDSIWTAEEECDDGNTTNGDGCSATCTVEQPNWVCSDPDTTSFDVLNSATGDAIIEGSLEDNRGRQSGAWIETASDGDLLPICTEVFCPFISINIASDGIFYALFGASADPSLTSIEQDTTIPTSASVLTFDLLVGICDSAADALTVEIDGTEVYRYDCTADTDDFIEQTANISAFADGGVHNIKFIGDTIAANGGNSNFFVDNISIPLPTPVVPTPSQCFERAMACDSAPTPNPGIETFDAGIPSSWTVVNLPIGAADGWGSTGDGICLSQNADVLVPFGPNLTRGAGGAACADSDATGQIAVDAGGTPAEMDTYLCSPELNLSNITGPQFSFNAYYQSADNQFNDNGTPDDFTDDFDEDLLEVVVGTIPPSAFSIGNYDRLGGVNDHEDGNLVLTGAQELVANLEGSLEGEDSGWVCFHYKGTYAWFAQIDNAGLRGDDCNLPPVDTDGDGVFDSTDNCLLDVNPDQIDTNGDGIGNRCDADIDNNCNINFLDFFEYTAAFGSAEGDPNYNPDVDADGSNTINFLDIFEFSSNFLMAPGPSANGCTPAL